MNHTFRAIFRGAASVLQVWAPRRQPRFGKTILGRTNRQALASDWQAVGRDMAVVIRRFKRLDPSGQFVEKATGTPDQVSSHDQGKSDYGTKPAESGRRHIAGQQTAVTG